MRIGCLIRRNGSRSYFAFTGTALYTVLTVPPGNHAAVPSGSDVVYVSVHVEPSVTVSANVGPDRPDPRQLLHGPPALKANCTTIGGPLAGVTVAIRVAGLIPLITPVIVFSSPAAQATAAIKNRHTTASVVTVLFVFIVVPLL